MEPRALTVSQLTRALADLVEDSFGYVRVEGEIGRFTRAASGHWYLSLKDEGAVLSVNVFRGVNARLGWVPREGERVVVTGELSIYPPRGTYSLNARNLERAGAGDLAARLEALKRKLAAEGLFAQERKRPLPPLPRAVGVATSGTGAAVQDILRVIEERWPGMTVYVAPCKVQGEGAAEDIARALRLLQAHGEAEVIIVGRGGGSAEDLWAFNEEVLVRAVAGCAVPVISAVGHETDVCLSDLAADVRAATPTHGAELAVPERAVLEEIVAGLQALLVAAAGRQVRARRERLRALRLRDPRRRVTEGRLRCDELDRRLHLAVHRRLERHRARLALQAGRLQALSPVAVLERGYAIALKGGRAVRRATELNPGDRIELRLGLGRAGARVEDVEG
ncbi:MAG: exodeoxyribonuclease VII large subunit [Pseudomonadota bacterium]